ESLTSLRDGEAPLAQLGIRLIGVCGDKARSLEQAAVRDSAGPLLLADVTGEGAALYGLWDGSERAIRPGPVLVDRDQRVRMALLGQTLPVDDVVKIIRLTVTGL